MPFITFGAAAAPAPKLVGKQTITSVPITKPAAKPAAKPATTAAKPAAKPATTAAKPAAKPAAKTPVAKAPVVATKPLTATQQAVDKKAQALLLSKTATLADYQKSRAECVAAGGLQNTILQLDFAIAIKTAAAQQAKPAAKPAVAAKPAAAKPAAAKPAAAKPAAAKSSSSMLPILLGVGALGGLLLFTSR